MNHQDQPQRRTILQDTLAKLRRIECRKPRDLAEFLKKENARFSANDLITFGHGLGKRFHRCEGILNLPDWLAYVFIALTDGIAPTTICDPWAGIGLLVGVLRETSRAKTSVAFTRNLEEEALGRVLVPDVNWNVGDPLSLIDREDAPFDIVASILPMNLLSRQPAKVTLPSGDVAELADDVGNQLLVAFAMRLSLSGIALFVVTSSAFFSPRSVFRRLNDFGIGIEAAFALPPGTFAPFTAIPAYLVVVRRRPSTRMFVAKLSADRNTNLQVIANFRVGTEGGSLELGRFVDPASFRGFEHLRASEAMTAAEKRFGVQASNLADLGDVKSGISMGRPGDEFTFQPLENAI